PPRSAFLHVRARSGYGRRRRPGPASSRSSGERPRASVVVETRLLGRRGRRLILDDRGEPVLLDEGAELLVKLLQLGHVVPGVLVGRGLAPLRGELGRLVDL